MEVPVASPPEHQSAPLKFLAHFRHKDERTFWIKREASIPEQIMKALHFAEAARSVGLFTKGKRHLIIGGGVTGVAAALAAAAPEVFFVVLEKAPHLFPVQADCTSRFLHPHEYLWPTIPFWPQPREDTHRFFPIFRPDQVSSVAPLRWEAGRASKIASDWQAQVRKESPVSLSFRFDSRTVISEGISLKDAFDPEKNFGVIIACLGAEERETVLDGGQFASTAYWAADAFEDENLPTSLGCRPLRILISGGGDGAQQDFLRLTLGRKSELFSAGALLRKLLGFLMQSLAFRDSVEYLLKFPNPARPPQAELWNVHRELMNSLARDAPVWSALRERLVSLIDPRILTKEKQVTLIFSGPTFSEGYSLNSLLVHLVASVLEQPSAESGRRTLVLRPNLEIARIRSASSRHVCAQNAAACCGKPHLVQFKNHADHSEEFDLILLRHGSEQVVPQPSVRLD